MIASFISGLMVLGSPVGSANPALSQDLLTLRANRLGGIVVQVPVDGVNRSALIFPPKIPSLHPPVVFCFHGHGGTMINAARTFNLQGEWPEALIVYGQGLPTRGALTDPQGQKNGWDVGYAETNKDLRYFDQLSKYVDTTYHPDLKRKFAMGHSNGGFFQYTLWAMRPNVFAGFGSFEAIMPQRAPSLPKPIFITIGESDSTVLPSWQKQTLARILALNGGAQSSRKEGAQETIYSGTVPTVYWSYPGGHPFDRAAVPALVRFFKGLTNSSPNEGSSTH